MIATTVGAAAICGAFYQVFTNTIDIAVQKERIRFQRELVEWQRDRIEDLKNKKEEKWTFKID
ncbi:hypothetical protein [Pseudovibrio ascidiaceicola]|uniref:hypothetical protein n=1 Tax=Pseudovibrio ascidiaceicola TaxID=285279 RepID=UPI001AD925B8|nr:hypothetical protein [Pseudovibrio ascidiaceicola]